jgi:AbrB family looped-hinge helix DNA binding protein
MRTTIDRLGRVVVPKPLRDRLGLRGGETLELEERDGVIELRPAAAEVRVADTAEGPVVEAVADVAPLTDAAARDVLEQVRR